MGLQASRMLFAPPSDGSLKAPHIQQVSWGPDWAARLARFWTIWLHFIFGSSLPDIVTLRHRDLEEGSSSGSSEDDEQGA